MQHLYLDNRDGFGARDFTKFYMDRGAFIRHNKNEPQLFEFTVSQVDVGDDNSNWTVPRRGAFVRFVDDCWESRRHPIVDGVLFTGFVTEDPEPVFLGVNNRQMGWAFHIRCTSEEFLCNSKRLQAGTYVNKTRGFIIKDVLSRLFKTSTPFPFNMAGVCDGGVEQLFQVDTNQSWAELVSAFAAADGFNYWILDSYIYYGPDDIVTTYNDPLYMLALDASDPRWTPSALDIKRVSRDIVNDVTVLGKDEPTDVVREHFVSDGYQGFHNLAFDPFGVEEDIIVEDDLTGDIDDGIWEQLDVVDDYIQAFEGALNIIGGPGAPLTSSEPRTVYLRARKPIEMSGVLEFRDGEIYFPPIIPSGTGWIGGLYKDETLSQDVLYSGWYLNLNNMTITPYGLDGVVQGDPYSLVKSRHYMLRRSIRIDRHAGASQPYLQTSTRAAYSYADSVTLRPNVFMSWIIDEINDDDPADVFTTTTIVASLTYAGDPPEYTLYAPVVPNDCHYVTNFLLVKKPQQAILKVNGRQQRLGSYLDGGRATIISENGLGKLSWYSVLGNDSPDTVTLVNTVLGDAPTAYWRLGETEGTTIYDSSGRNNNGVISGAYDLNQDSAVASDDDPSIRFYGDIGVKIEGGAPVSTGIRCSYAAWFKSSSASPNQTIWSNRTAAGDGDFLALVDGHVFYGASDVGGISSTRADCNDGRWHHVIWTVDGYGSGDLKAYIFLRAIGNVSDGDTVTLGTVTYTFQNTLTNVAGHVQIGATDGDSMHNLEAAVMAGAGSGTAYAAATTANPDVDADQFRDIPNIAVFRALVAGSVGNLIGCTSTGATMLFYGEGTIPHDFLWLGADAAATAASSLYIDGVLDSTGTQFKSAKNNVWYIGYDLYVDTVTPGGGRFEGTLDEVALFDGIVLTAAQVKAHYHRSAGSNGEIVTVPPAGSRIELSYYRKQTARARLRSHESIDTERVRYRDDGVRQKIMRAEDVKPVPRSSEECLSLAQAYLYDAGRLRYEGTYSFDAVQYTPTELRFWPRPGDKLPCLLELPNGELVNELLNIQTVDSEFTGKESYAIKVGFGPINRFDIVIRNMILKRKTSFEDPIIRTEEADVLEILNAEYPYPADVLDCTVTNISATSFTIALATAGIPDDVVNYDIREDDTGWGVAPTASESAPPFTTAGSATSTSTNKPPVARFCAPSFTLQRTKRDLRYFIRPYNAAGQYSKRSAFVRVACPTLNNYTVVGVTGTISGSRVRVNIPIPRDPDYAGVILRQNDALGPIIYQGNGDQHKVILAGVDVLLTAGTITVDFPNLTGAQTFTAWANTYNLLNLFGVAQVAVISIAAPGAWTASPYDTGDFTGSGLMAWHVPVGSIVTHTFAQTGTTMTASIDIALTSVDGTLDDTLRIVIPNGKVAARAMSNGAVITDDGTRVAGTISVEAGGTRLLFKRMDMVPFLPAVDTTSVQGQLIFEVLP
jgi:hypothetical protein